jgi:hypothetical protein
MNGGRIAGAARRDGIVGMGAIAYQIPARSGISAGKK